MNTNYYGLKKSEYINLLIACGMTTKKWTYAKIKSFHEGRLEILARRDKKLKTKLEKIEKSKARINDAMKLYEQIIIRGKKASSKGKRGIIRKIDKKNRI